MGVILRAYVDCVSVRTIVCFEEWVEDMLTAGDDTYLWSRIAL
jgi:hypothetical protein